MKKIFYFLMLSLFISCSINGRLETNLNFPSEEENKCNIDNDCPILENVCKVAKCVDGVCKENNLENYTSCGEGSICIDGECSLNIDCSFDSDCPSIENVCKVAKCTQNTCVEENLANYTQCSSNSACIDGVCSEVTFCSIDSECDDDKFCTEDLCIQGICQNTNIENGTTCGQAHVCAFGNCIFEDQTTCVSDIQCDDGSECTADYCSNFKCIHVDVVGGGITTLCKDGEILYDISCQINNDCNNDFDPCYQTNGYCINNVCKFFPVDYNTCGENKYCSDGYCYEKIACSITQDCIDLITVGQCSSDYFLEDTTCVNSEYCYFSTGPHSYQNNNICSINNKNGVCDQGICYELFNCDEDSDCDDGNPCTINKCTNYDCDYSNFIDNGVQCSQEGYCLNGTCVDGNCNSDDDCLEDTFCKDFYCDLNDFNCKYNSLNQNGFCNSEYGYLFTCNNGICSFDPQDIGLCSEPQSIPQDKPHGIIVSQEALSLNSGEELFGVACKFEDEGTYKCGNATYILKSGIGILFGIFKDNPQTPQKDGFTFNERIYFFIRTTNYVCRVSAEFDPEFYGTNRWGALGLSRILKFVEFEEIPNAPFEDIDFSNTQNCVNVSN